MICAALRARFSAGKGFIPFPSKSRFYIYNNKNTFTEWYNGKESDIPREYRVMSFPQPDRPDPSKVEMDAAAPGQKAAQTAEQPQEPRPVIPIVLTSEKPAEKLKEITDRLEQGITELFESERYREYLRVMSKFHNYSLRPTSWKQAKQSKRRAVLSM